MSHLLPNLSGRPYLRYGQLFTLRFPNTLVFDDGSQFRDNFVETCEIHEVEWPRSETQAHCALGIGDIYHEPIRRTFLKLQIDHPKQKKEFLVSLAVKACNNTLRAEGVLSSELVF